MNKYLLIKSVGIIPMYNLTLDCDEVCVIGHKRNLEMLRDIHPKTKLYIYPHNHEFRLLDLVVGIDGKSIRLTFNDYNRIVIPLTQNDPLAVKNIIDMLIEYEPSCGNKIWLYDTSTTHNPWIKFDQVKLKDPTWHYVVSILGLLITYPLIKLKLKLDFRN